jgi:P4 family phage/plasmid primase-like protien
VIQDTTEPMTWLDVRKTQPSCIALANGILDMDALLAGKGDCLQPHTPLWFSPVCLSYPFDPRAACETWTRTLYHNLENDGERIALLQEWFGYMLLPDTSQQKFLVCEGEGSNGKSVVCAVLEAMLGKENVSHVALEVFGQRFQLTPTLGKLANISADVGELEKTAEGFLKSYTGGDTMTFDRKGLPPIDAAPTARLTIAANNRPRFSDRSSGLWRRMMVIPFKVEIADGDKIHGMDKPAWWIASGELSGVFNWAVAGLYRLRKQGRFTQSTLCQEALADYRVESNPARGFLEEYCEANSLDKTESQELYDAYKTWCGKNGYRPLGEKIFGKEVKRVFPNAEKKRLGPRGDRFYAYQGVTFFADKF